MTLLAALALGFGACVAALVIFAALVGRRSRARVPPIGEFMEVRGARVHYVDRGKGRPIVMIHGLGCQLNIFSCALLGLLVDRYRVVLIDRPGSGYSTAAPGAGASLAMQAAVVAGVIERLGLVRPVVVGHSLGGAVALRLVLDHPDRVGALALIAPLTAAPKEVPEVFRDLMIARPWVRRIIAHTVAMPLMLRYEKRGRVVVFAPEPVPDYVDIEGGALLVLRPEAFAAASADIAHIAEELASMAQRYAIVRHPIDILYGRGDRILDPEEHGGKLAARLASVRLTLCEGGHMLPLTQPALVAQWLDRAFAPDGVIVTPSVRPASAGT